jgi:uncharacterized membrane protein YhhN
MPNAIIFAPLIVLAAALAIHGDYRGPRRAHYVGKPLATIAIIALALTRAPDAPRTYALAILIGLICSLAGDIALMLPGDRFVVGLIAFLLAHIAYIVAFATAPGARLGPLTVLTFTPLLIYGALVFRTLAPHLGPLRLPVVLYLLVIVAMASFALDRWRTAGSSGAALAACGALLFVVSDTFLARNRFVAPFGAAQALILGTYFAAQWLIALSL